MRLHELLEIELARNDAGNLGQAIELRDAECIRGDAGERLRGAEILRTQFVFRTEVAADRAGRFAADDDRQHEHASDAFAVIERRASAHFLPLRRIVDDERFAQQARGRAAEIGQGDADELLRESARCRNRPTPFARVESPEGDAVRGHDLRAEIDQMQGDIADGVPLAHERRRFRQRIKPIAGRRRRNKSDGHCVRDWVQNAAAVPFAPATVCDTTGSIFRRVDRSRGAISIRLRPRSAGRSDR